MSQNDLSRPIFLLTNIGYLRKIVLMKNGKEAILEILRDCRDCPGVACVRLVTPVISKPALQVEAMGLRSGQAVSNLVSLEPAPAEIREKILPASDGLEVAVWDAQYRVQEGEAGQAFPVTRPPLQN